MIFLVFLSFFWSFFLLLAAEGGITGVSLGGSPECHWALRGAQALKGDAGLTCLCMNDELLWTASCWSQPQPCLHRVPVSRVPGEQTSAKELTSKAQNDIDSVLDQRQAAKGRERCPLLSATPQQHVPHNKHRKISIAQKRKYLEGIQARQDPGSRAVSSNDQQPEIGQACKQSQGLLWTLPRQLHHLHSKLRLSIGQYVSPVVQPNWISWPHQKQYPNSLTACCFAQHGWLP